MPANLKAPWLQLIRPPNQFTVPGDVIAGFAIAGGFAESANIPLWKLVPLIAASLLLYCGGLLLNDWADRDVDLQERPDRPIPSGAVSASAVRNAGILANLAAIGIAAIAGMPSLVVAAVLAVFATLYNVGGKKIPIVGVPLMAGCRVLNLALGASLLTASAMRIVPAAIAVGIFLIAICLVAKDEAERTPPKWVIILVPIATLAALFPGAPGFNLPGIKCAAVWLACLLTIGAAIQVTRTLWRATSPKQIPPTVGAMIRMLILLQAFWTAAAGAPCVVVAAILLLWPLGRATGRWFYAS